MKKTSKPQAPPAVVKWLLKRRTFYEEEYSNSGNLHEEFTRLISEKSLFYARSWYCLQVFLSIGYYLKIRSSWSFIMLANYVKIAFRNLKKYQGYSLINITGLAIGIVCCLLIFLFVSEELSYDNFHKDLERLYRVVMHYESEGFTRDFAKVGPSVGQRLREDFPEVEYVARMMKYYRPLISWGDKKFYEGRCYHTEPEIFDILSTHFISGDPKTALLRSHTAVISAGMVNKYFGSENPIGKLLTIDSEHYEITGIIEDYPSNTHLKCDFLLSFKTIKNEDMATEWGWTNFQTYLKLSPNVNVENFRIKIAQIENHYRDKDTLNRYYLQNIKNIHLDSHLTSETEPPGNPASIYITITIGILILIIACINYFNLTTARYANRAGEVGIRKVVGAKRQQLVIQFLGESTITTIFAFLLALIITWFALPLLNQLTNNIFTLKDFTQPKVLLTSIALILFVGVVSGSYPALILSLFNPSSVFKSAKTNATKGSVIRKFFVLGQFAVTIIFIIGTLVVYKQLHFMRTTNLGFAKQQKLVLPIEGDNLKNQQYETLKSEFLKLAQISGVTVSSGVPGSGVGAYAASLEGQQNNKSQSMSYLFLDFDFISDYEMKIVAGRDFDREMISDLNEAFIINESAVTAFGFRSPAQLINKQMTTGYRGNGTIIGVVKDFHYDGLQRKIEPLIFAIGPDKGLNMFNKTGALTLTLTTEKLPTTITEIKKTWQRMNQTIPFSFQFFNDIFDVYYKAEIQTRQIISLFTFLGLFISCLGLFGLATFIAEQRTKEIGIRKVLGASVGKIIVMISKDFLKWILLANFIAWPIAYFFLNIWLQNFAYKVNIGIPIFLFSALIVLFIAILTVGYQSIRSAMANPIDSLKYE